MEEEVRTVVCVEKRGRPTFGHNFSLALASFFCWRRKKTIYTYLMLRHLLSFSGRPKVHQSWEMLSKQKGSFSSVFWCLASLVGLLQPLSLITFLPCVISLLFLLLRFGHCPLLFCHQHDCELLLQLIADDLWPAHNERSHFRLSLVVITDMKKKGNYGEETARENNTQQHTRELKSIVIQRPLNILCEERAYDDEVWMMLFSPFWAVSSTSKWSDLCLLSSQRLKKKKEESSTHNF